MKPCKSCPFRTAATRGLWDPAHYLAIAYLGSARDHTGRVPAVMGCHQFNGTVRPRPPVLPPPCGGWVRAAADSMGVRFAMFAGQCVPTDVVDQRPGEILSPEAMAEANGLDLARLPPLAWSRDDPRYPQFADWQQAVTNLLDAVAADPDIARDYVRPGSPLATWRPTYELVEAQLGKAAADHWLETQAEATERAYLQ